MPELPEVQTVVITLAPKLVGRRVAAVDLARTDVLEPPTVDLSEHLPGRQIAQVTRRGKRIVFTLNDGNRFFIHLGMSGRLTVEDAHCPVLKHTHLRLIFDGSTQELRFNDPRRFGGIWWLGTNGLNDETMGPEPLNVRPDQLARRLAKTRRAIKSALLDQSVLAGLGNIYVDEALFAAGIHPLTSADRLSAAQVRRLNRSIKAVLRRAIRHRGSTLRDYRDAEGNEGAFQKLHRVYGREGKPCPNCRSSIERLVLGGRSTHFCPCCQSSGDDSP